MICYYSSNKILVSYCLSVLLGPDHYVLVLFVVVVVVVVVVAVT